MASEYTPNRRYPLYTDNDKPNLRDQYNGAIREIDTDMAQALADSSGVASALGAGFDAQHTVRMAIDDMDGDITALQSADTALGTRITNETTARESADTALGTRITNETSARESADSSLSTRITKLESGTKYTLVIGDSNSDESDEWPVKYGQNLNRGMIRKAQGGMGFSVGNNTFIQQLQSGINDPNFADCDEIIVYGVSNDWAHNLSYDGSWLQAYFAAFKQLFDTVNNGKRRLVFALGNNGNGGGRTGLSQARAENMHSFPAFVSTAKQAARNVGMPGIVDNVEWWLACLPQNAYESDGLHYNAYGDTIVASYFEAIHNGTYDGVHREYNLKPEAEAAAWSFGSDARRSLSFHNGMWKATLSGINLDASQLEGTGWSRITTAQNLPAAYYWIRYGSNVIASAQNPFTHVSDTEDQFTWVYVPSGEATVNCYPLQLVFNDFDLCFYGRPFGNLSGLQTMHPTLNGLKINVIGCN